MAVEATIDETGHVSATRVVSSAAPELNEAATAAVHPSTFRPGMKDGKAVAVKTTITIWFAAD